jgi:hypothetical protein
VQQQETFDQSNFGRQANYDLAYMLPSPYKTDGSPMWSAKQFLSWSKEVVAEGTAFLKNQPAYSFIQDGLDMINGKRPANNAAGLSDVQMELTIRNLKELVAAQTNLRIIPSFKTQIKELAEQVPIQNDCFLAWQQSTFADRRIREAWQYAAACGTGYNLVTWEPNFYNRGKGDIALTALGPLDVMPVGLPKGQMNPQKAYCTAIRIRMPYHEAVRKFPKYADKIKPSRSSAMRGGVVQAAAAKFASAVLRKFNGAATDASEDKSTWDTVDVYYLYVDDNSVNYTGKEVPMGTPGTSWYYVVPFVGMRIPVGDPTIGATREAGPEDCLFYPTRRLVKCTDTVCLNPDPMDQVNPYWHSAVPLIKYQADDWAWNYLGFPLTRGGASLEKANNTMERAIVDSSNARLNPARAYDRNLMAGPLAEAINPRIPGGVVGLDMTYGGDQFKPLLDYRYYEFPDNVPEQIKLNEARITHQMGVADAQALSRARQLPSSDSTEKILEALGPLVKDQSRNMEESIMHMGTLWLSNFFQFYTAKRRLSIVGAKGVADQDFDFDPGSLVPSDSPYTVGSMLHYRNGTPAFERARWHSDQFSFNITPYSIHELNSMTRKLFNLQLMRAGFPIDWWTLAELFDVQNFSDGNPMYTTADGEQKEATTVLERWTVQQEMQIRAAVAQQQAVAAAAGAAGGGAPGGAGAGPPGGHQQGRPPSGQVPPTLEQKNRGGDPTSSTIRESAR